MPTTLTVARADDGESEARSSVDELHDQLHKNICYGSWKCWSDDYKETFSLKAKKYTLLMQRDAGALRRYMFLVQQILSMKDLWLRKYCSTQLIQTRPLTHCCYTVRRES